jgi:hypothetical protein
VIDVVRGDGGWLDDEAGVAVRSVVCLCCIWVSFLSISSETLSLCLYDSQGHLDPSFQLKLIDVLSI